jgi:ABC-type lipoprotein release transport system permease subunit
MIILRLAIRNLLGAGLRTGLNVFILSLAFVSILWSQGLIDGMGKQAMDAMKDMELGGGQYWHSGYDPFNPLTLENAHGLLSTTLKQQIKKGAATPILITLATAYPRGRARTILLKGMDPRQKILRIPSNVLVKKEWDGIPGLIGRRMARETGLKTGDAVTVRWRDVHGVFDARDIVIAGIMTTSVPSVDANQIWAPLDDLRSMLRAPEEATLVVLERGFIKAAKNPEQGHAWTHRDLDFLLADMQQFVKVKSLGNMVVYILLLFMGLLAIFDTQVLAIFRRRKEIGTLMALGMSRIQLVSLFTLEGALHGVMALLAGAVYGIPLLVWSAKTGLSMPEITENMGMAIANTLYPAYGFSLVAGTTLLVLVTVTVVSYLPARKIARLNPVDALKGKIT